MAHDEGWLLLKLAVFVLLVQDHASVREDRLVSCESFEFPIWLDVYSCVGRIG